MTVEDFASLFHPDAEISASRADREWHVAVVLPCGEQLFASASTLGEAIDRVLYDPQVLSVSLADVALKPPTHRLALVAD